MGLLAAVSGRPEAGALRLSLTGQGPLSSWRGKLAVDAERLANLDLAVDLAYADQKRLAMTGTLDAAQGALPANLADVDATMSSWRVAGETAPGAMQLDDLRLQMASLSLQGSGSAILAADDIAKASFELDAPGRARFAGLAATEVAGKASLQVSASGAAAQPELKLALDGSDLRRRASPPPTSPVPSMSLSPHRSVRRRSASRRNGTATIEGLTQGGRDLGDGGRLRRLSTASFPAGVDEISRATSRCARLWAS